MGFDTEAALKWIYDCKNRECTICEAYPSWQKGEVSSRCASGYLLSEVPEPPKVPRWKTAKTQEDFDKIRKDYVSFCDARGGCPGCPYWKKDTACYHAYYSELVEAKE